MTALPKTDSPEELAAAYTAADVFVHPGVEETFGLTVAEAQACGTTAMVVEGTACAEIADPVTSIAIKPSFDDLKAHVIKLRGGGIVILFERTDSPEQLAGVYSAADVLFNPTLEDNYPTVNLEAESCGTAVVTYDTGGCRETVARADSCVVFDFASAVGRIRAAAEIGVVRA